MREIAKVQMKRYSQIALVTLMLFVLPHQSSPTGQAGFPDLTLKAVTKTKTETFTDQTHAWKIHVKSEPPVMGEYIEIEVLEGKSVNPSLRSGGSVDFSSLKAIVGDVTSPGMNDEQKALALWRFAMDNLYNGPWGTSMDGLEHLNVYGYGYCGTYAAVLESLWWAAGLKARHVNIGNHAATEVYYDNDWHYIDSHKRCFFLERDNRSIASLDDLNLDPDLWDMRRQKHSSKRGAKKDYYMSMHPGDHGRSPVYSNAFLMGKGDVLTLTWRKNGKWCLARGAEGRGQPAPEPEIYANGSFRFHRDLSDPSQHRTGLVTSKNIDWQDLSLGYLHPMKANQEASLIYEVRVPYFIPSATFAGKFLRNNPDDLVAVDISTDNGNSWTQLWNAKELRMVEANVSTEKTQEITTDTVWKYSYLLRVRMKAVKSQRDVGAYLIESTATLVFNPMALPSLLAGDNTMTFRDQGKAPHTIRVSYGWQENLPVSSSRERPLEGEQVTLSARITNQGSAAAHNVPVVFYHGNPAAGGVEIGRDSIKTIAAGETAVGRVKWKARRDKSPRKGENSVGATIFTVVDPANVLQESDKKNNTFLRTLKVLNPPEVSIPSPSFIRLERKNGKSDIITINATVRNFSNATHYGHYLSDHAEATEVKVKIFDGEPRTGRQIGSDQIITRLLPLEFKNISVDWDISQLKGQHRIYAQIFSPKNVTEAGFKKAPYEASTFVDLDAYRRCGQ
ncbi:putative CARDB domain lipoprotein [Candidatus Sulfobium mesophilum]|uniref:Putative CARDB domain lipoprotein n=1 Tax=Candidatus Sulfobium mesophilum TaxID=2016548 RepID=A0A2U3QDM6_9BACT|nr:putative CARDB domain lipoprotein [Candidatus Sulfobium mesophilum]